MQTQKLSNYKANYGVSRIELWGEHTAIHQEAQRIVRCFSSSALPYRISIDSERYIMLRAVH